jgi:hypothetical protein
MSTEVWLRGPLVGIPVLLQPVAHALLQARDEVTTLMADFPEELLWEKPAGLASPGFHLQHLTGVLDRLFTYARAGQLTAHQLRNLAAEGSISADSRSLVTAFNLQVDAALIQLGTIGEMTLTETREVGRTKLPSTVIGLYVHAAEHTMRHVGQLLVTTKILVANRI